MTLLALLGGQAGRERADDDRIVARQHQIDHQHLDEGGKGRGLGDVRKVVDDDGPRFPQGRRNRWQLR